MQCLCLHFFVIIYKIMQCPNQVNFLLCVWPDKRKLKKWNTVVQYIKTWFDRFSGQYTKKCTVFKFLLCLLNIYSKDKWSNRGAKQIPTTKYFEVESSYGRHFSFTYSTIKAVLLSSYKVSHFQYIYKECDRWKIIDTHKKNRRIQNKLRNFDILLLNSTFGAKYR